MDYIKQAKEQIMSMSPEKQEELMKELNSKLASLRFIPNAGPQTEAYFSPADELLYGGSAGSGKSGLILGLAFTQHDRTLIMRRKYTDLDGLTEDALRLFGDKCKLIGGSRPKIKTDDNRAIDFGAARNEGDEGSWMGVPHDLLCFDELTQFTEYQYKYLQTWLRTVKKGQRTRIIGATNPPTSVEGEWVIKRWAAWLDPTHSNPAKPGELRWYVTDPDGKDMEVPDDKPVNFPGRPNPSLPKSRTFIPGKVADNPYLGSDYVATLDTLPEPLRSAMRDGNFMMSRKDVDWQTIPTAWVDDAMARWHKMKAEARGTPMCAIGVDVCQAGGNDNAVLARRYDGWYDELITVPGSKLKTEDDITALILKHRRDGAEITIDSSGGYGTHTVEQLKSNDIEANRYIGKKNTDRRSVHGRFGFPNTRSAAYWLFREALDPSQPGGSQIALPSDMELRSELTAPTYELTTKGFKIENKEDVKDKLGRSPDKADAVVMAWFYGRKGIMSSHPSQIYARMNNSSTKKNVVVKLSNSQRTRRGR